MKVCSTCKQSKDESCFTKDKRMRDGLRSQCKECHNTTTRAWRAKNKDRIKATTRANYEKNRDKYLEKARKQWENLDEDARQKRAEYHKEYYQSRRDEYLEKQRDRRKNRSEEQKQADYLRAREYYDKNKETIKKRAREWYRNLTDKQKQENTQRTKDWRRRNSEKTKAWSAVGNALFSGEIEKPPYCELCGAFDVKIHAHHEDYSKPLDVLWLCHDCHMGLHADKRLENECVEGKNNGTDQSRNLD